MGTFINYRTLKMKPLFNAKIFETSWALPSIHTEYFLLFQEDRLSVLIFKNDKFSF